jgi:hypothetical protein
LKRKSSIPKAFKSNRGSSDFKIATPGRSLVNSLTRDGLKDYSENVSDEYGYQSFNNKFISLTKQITNKQSLRRGMTIYSVIDPFLTELDDYGEDDYGDAYESLFSD